MAADNFSKWLGGPDYIKAQQWGVGRTNSGEQRKRLNLTKRGRFNPNPTSCSHPGCQIAAQSARDKAAHIKKMESR